MEKQTKKLESSLVEKLKELKLFYSEKWKGDNNPSLRDDVKLKKNQSIINEDLIKKIVDGKYNKRNVILWGDGNQKREIINVADFVYALFSLRKKSNEIINIGGGKSFSIKYFSKIIFENLIKKFPKIYIFGNFDFVFEIIFE